MPDTATASNWRLDTIEGGVTAPGGFRAAGGSCGIKDPRLAFAMIVPDGAASAAGLFTTSLAQAAPVVLSRQHLLQSGGLARAVVVNSGCANACTGVEGDAVARATADLAARERGCPPAQGLGGPAGGRR